MSSPEPTPTQPTVDELAEARRIVAEADAREAEDARVARLTALAPLIAVIDASGPVLAALRETEAAFIGDRDVSAHLAAVSIGLDGLMQYTGHTPAQIAGSPA